MLVNMIVQVEKPMLIYHAVQLILLAEDNKINSYIQ